MREIRLIARPEGVPTADLFEFADSPDLEPAPGTALVENLWLSVDPYMRELMDDGWDLNQPGEGPSYCSRGSTTSAAAAARPSRPT